MVFLVLDNHSAHFGLTNFITIIDHLFVLYIDALRFPIKGRDDVIAKPTRLPSCGQEAAEKLKALK